MLEDDLSYSGTPAGFSGKEWNDEREKFRAKLEAKGDLEGENDAKTTTGKGKRKSAINLSSKAAAPMGSN